MCVLTYYRSEWTDVADDDEQHVIAITREVRHLIRGCWSRKTPVPNAAKEVDIFLRLPEIIEDSPPSESGE
jgi:hypothetical protein